MSPVSYPSQTRQTVPFPASMRQVWKKCTPHRPSGPYSGQLSSACRTWRIGRSDVSVQDSFRKTSPSAAALSAASDSRACRPDRDAISLSRLFFSAGSPNPVMQLI